MTKTRLALVVLFTVTVVILFANHLVSLAYAQQRVTRNPRLTIIPVGVLDAPKSGISAAFVKDTKTGECWLWVNEPGQGSTLAQAKESACN
jgi:hypothetical protein